FTLGMSVMYSCDPGYYLIGNGLVLCRASGNWSLPTPRCEEVKCSRPPNIANGQHSGRSSHTFPRGTTVTYTCREGYTMVGNMSINCSDTGLW
ncbi:CR2 protein, partial [Nothoprocta ornata]|nr:CR2 protein [Nothoprocta ornata]